MRVGKGLEGELNRRPIDQAFSRCLSIIKIIELDQTFRGLIQGVDLYGPNNLHKVISFEFGHYTEKDYARRGLPERVSEN